MVGPLSSTIHNLRTHQQIYKHWLRFLVQFIDQMDEGARMSTELDQLLNQAVDEERYDDAARLRRQVLADASASLIR